MEGWATMAKRLGSLVFALSVLLVAYPPPAGGTKSQDCPAAKPAPPGKNTSTPSTPTAPIAPPPRLTVEVGQVSLAGILVVTSDQEKTFAPDISKNDLFFPKAKGSDANVKAKVVTPDGRTLVAALPPGALSGTVRIEVTLDGDKKTLSVPLAVSTPSWYFPGSLLLYLPVGFAGIVFLVILYVLGMGLRQPGNSASPPPNKSLEAKPTSTSRRWNLWVALADKPGVPSPPVPGVQAALADQPQPPPDQQLSSLSRFIAFIGALVLIPWSAAILALTVYWYALTGTIDQNLSNLTGLFVAQVGFFFPYVANQVKEIFKK